jgi:anti-sigma factor ChrR (cupin superfamily)
MGENIVEKIIHEGELLSIIIRTDFKSSGIEFFTPDDYSQQLGYMNRKQGYIIPPHWHNLVERKVVLTQEVLLIRSGKVRVDFYDNDQKYLESRILYSGDVILLAAGGHGFKILETAEIIEVKQGPYCGEQDKVRFESASEFKIKIRQ